MRSCHFEFRSARLAENAGSEETRRPRRQGCRLATARSSIMSYLTNDFSPSSPIFYVAIRFFNSVSFTKIKTT